MSWDNCWGFSDFWFHFYAEILYGEAIDWPVQQDSSRHLLPAVTQRGAGLHPPEQREGSAALNGATFFSLQTWGQGLGHSLQLAGNIQLLAQEESREWRMTHSTAQPSLPTSDKCWAADFGEEEKDKDTHHPLLCSPLIHSLLI